MLHRTQHHPYNNINTYDALTAYEPVAILPLNKKVLKGWQSILVFQVFWTQFDPSLNVGIDFGSRFIQTKPRYFRYFSIESPFGFHRWNIGRYLLLAVPSPRSISKLFNYLGPSIGKVSLELLYIHRLGQVYRSPVPLRCLEEVTPYLPSIEPVLHNAGDLKTGKVQLKWWIYGFNFNSTVSTFLVFLQVKSKWIRPPLIQIVNQLPRKNNFFLVTNLILYKII